VPPLHKNINCNVFPDDQGKITNGKEVKCLEMEGVKAAESGDLDTAIAAFTKVINIAPQWASGYNNRAQAYRLKGDTQGVYASPNTCTVYKHVLDILLHWDFARYCQSSIFMGPLQPLMNCVLFFAAFSVLQ
jgi:hypothetical protein